MSGMNQVVQQLRRAVLFQDGAGLSDGQLLGWFVERGDETAFALWRQAGSGSFVRISVLTPNTTSALDASVTSGTPYTYEVRAIGLGLPTSSVNMLTPGL